VDNQILTELRKPFHPSAITWRPGAISKDKTKALALAYADLRAYQNRLDEVCGMDWSVTYTPWADRLICHLTIAPEGGPPVTRSSTGEPDSQSERSEIAGTASEAQAYKRACAMFGLGRYLYNLPSLWVEYDAINQRFAEKSKARLQGLIAQHYQRYLDGCASDIQAGDEDEAATPQTSALDALGQELYGESWATVRQKNINRITNNQPDQLTAENIQALIAGMNELKKKRQAAPAQRF